MGKSTISIGHFQLLFVWSPEGTSCFTNMNSFQVAALSGLAKLPGMTGMV
jgi:hypothetical protein